MNFLKKDQFQQGPDLTEDIFLETIAKRICEKVKYDIDDIDSLKNAISNLHSRQVKSRIPNHDNDLDFFTALKRIDPDFAKTVEEAQNDAISTLQRTHNDKNREQIYSMLETPGSATFGQEISRMIGQEMFRNKTGASWEG